MPRLQGMPADRRSRVRHCDIIHCKVSCRGRTTATCRKARTRCCGGKTRDQVKAPPVGTTCLRGSGAAHGEHVDESAGECLLQVATRIKDDLIKRRTIPEGSQRKPGHNSIN